VAAEILGKFFARRSFLNPRLLDSSRGEGVAAENFREFFAQKGHFDPSSPGQLEGEGGGGEFSGIIFVSRPF